MSRALIRFLVLSLLLGASAALTACGDDHVAPDRPVDPRANRPKKSKSTQDVTGLVDIHLTNPRWDILKGHFIKMATKRHTPVHDAFKPQVLNFIPRPEMPEMAEIVEDVETDVEEVRGPLQLFPLSDYELLLVMSGTAVPKALVADPKGQTHVITRDMRMGDAGGIVEHVSQYMIVVREPNTERPYKLTIKPAFMDMTSKLAPSRRQSETADATPPPETSPNEP